MRSTNACNFDVLLFITKFSKRFRNNSITFRQFVIGKRDWKHDVETMDGMGEEKGGGNRSPLNGEVCGGRRRGRAVSRAGRIVIIQHVYLCTTGDIGSRSRSPHNGSNRREECSPTLNLLPPRPVTKIKVVRSGTRR